MESEKTTTAQTVYSQDGMKWTLLRGDTARMVVELERDGISGQVLVKVDGALYAVYENECDATLITFRLRRFLERDAGYAFYFPQKDFRSWLKTEDMDAYEEMVDAIATTNSITADKKNVEASELKKEYLKR